MTELHDLADLTTESVIQLYHTYLDSLRGTREEQRELRQRGMLAQLDDIEAELLYLQLRQRRPERVVEIGALHGWSTTWILRALRDNGAGQLLTIDLRDTATVTVPRELRHRWSFRQGDVRTMGGDWVPRTDHLLIDAKHSRRFARWYLAEVLPDLADSTRVSVHDVYRFRRPLPRSEGAELLAWLRRRRLRHFTASRAAAPGVRERIAQFRHKRGLVDPVHSGTRDPMVFFRTGGMPATADLAR
ncbi:class I SAM-dependent methyltransferase [Saccharomonospora piscinae]|uniref:class I SAM-dependent methyltransferase n=1 Tax=Saccharomonospora piscinae TaxID=687388 RepID=UPI001106B807|nr:class I SAM-dependent methyltransferase [Saccharomonospora piscinae]TLW90487.1 class I SAM-dependent methyltransferase [Saccharomonospora piscinae]